MSQTYSDRRRFLISGYRFCLATMFGLSGAAMLPATAYATDALDTYRAQGIIVERFDGFVELRDGSAPSAARALVTEVNAKRRAIYQKRSAEQNVSVDAVGKIFASKIVETAPAGTLFLQPGGGYVKK